MKFTDRFVDLATRPMPLRALVMRRLLQRFPIGSWEMRLRSGAVNRPHYAWCLHYAAVQAKGLGYDAMTVIELGVAGGNGLLCLAEHAAEIRKQLDLDIHLVGFDSAGGLPTTSDVRDLHYLWASGSFEMNRSALEERLAGRAELVLGNVSETVPGWTPPDHAPLGCVMFDLDLYTSTRDALPLLTKTSVLPRIWCYFDDISGFPDMALTDFIGEGAALHEFNHHPDRQILRDNVSPASIFAGAVPEMWHRKMYIYHRLSHPQYDVCLSREKHQLRLTD
jgi:hypothetical protein